MKEVEKHYKTREAASLLGVHLRTIQQWVKSGELAPVVQLGLRDVRIPATALQTFLDDRTLRRGASAL